MKIGLIQQMFQGSKEKTIEHTTNLIKEAKRGGSELVVLQELHTTQYFCQSENPDFFDLGDDYKKDIEYFSNIAKEQKIVLVTSLFEKRAVGLYHNTAYVFDTDGSLAGKYRKMHIPDDPAFYEKFYFTEGDLGFKPIKTSLGNLGVLVCWDQWYPEAARLMALNGADILIYPTAIGWFDSDTDEERANQLEAWVTIQRGHAVANGLYVVSVNRVGFEADDSKVLDGIRFWGNSFVAGPQGEFIARASSDKEEVMVVDIELSKSEAVRRMWPFLRDRRIDSYGDILKRYND
jgi:N-carbamoylputrescine amidase